MLEQISRAVDGVAPTDRSLVVDLFTGSGVVARRLSQSYPVLATDVQEYSRVIASALLAPEDVDFGDLVQFRKATQSANDWMNHLRVWEQDRLRAGPENLADDIESGSLHLRRWLGDRSDIREVVAAATEGRAEWTTLHYYGGVYFSYQQAMEIDVIASWARSRSQGRDTALAAILGTAGELVSSVGSHFAQPLRPRDPGGRLKSRQLAAAVNKRLVSPHDVYRAKLHQFARLSAPRYPALTARADFRETLAGLTSETAVVYADPPYTRDHYSRFYHVLETMARGDDPGVSKMRLGDQTLPSRGLYRIDRHQSPFSIVSEAPHAFRQMFEAIAEVGSAMVLSYSPIPENEKPRARVIDLPSLLALTNDHFERVETISADGLKHSKFNAARLNAPAVSEAEVLIIAS